MDKVIEIEMNKPKKSKLRQKIARAGNEVYRKKCKSEATKKEKQILKELKIQMGKVKLTLQNIIQYKQKLINHLWHKKVKLKKMAEKGKRIKDDTVVKRDQKKN